jgi:hypothetical protein
VKRKHKQVMVKYSSNINKTNNHFSHQTTEHKNTLEIQVLVWDMQTSLAMLNRLIGPPF